MVAKVNQSSIPKSICPLCRIGNVSSVGSPVSHHSIRKLSSEQYKVVICRDCRFYFVLPEISLTADEWQELYSEDYFGKLTAWWEKRRQKDRIDRLNLLSKYCEGNIRKFLDVGCGEGLVLITALEKGWDPNGIDILDHRARDAKRKDITFVKGDLLTGMFPDNHFDVIHMDSVLEHVLDPLAYLNELYRILRPGGCIYIGVPNEDALFVSVKGLLYNLSGRSQRSPRIKPFAPPFHVIGFTKKSLKIAFDLSGFEILKLRNFGGMNEWLKQPFISKMFLVHLALLPIQIFGFLLRRQTYLEAVISKK